MHTLDINITNSCNYKCEFCYTNPKAKGDIKKETFKKILEFAKLRRVKYLSFCGGEPLLNKNFKELVEKSKKAGYKLILRTNGIFFDKYIDLISDNFEWVCFSLDGTEQANDKMRMAKNKITSFQKFNIPINNIIELRKKNKKIKIMLASVVSKINYKDFPLLEKYILKNKLPINLWKIYLFKPSEGRALVFENKYILSQTKFLELGKKINIEKLEEIGIKTIFQNYSVKKSECIIVTAGGDLNLAQNKLFNLRENTLEEINNFFSQLEIKEVENNKKATYY